MFERFEIQTAKRTDFVDVTGRVRDVVCRAGIQEGLCVVYVPHTTAAVTINEHADPDVVRDMGMKLDWMIPWEDAYRHAEGNSAAHIKSSLLGPSLSIIVQGSELVLGVWQGVFLCEFDGPRRRSFFVKVIEG